MLAGAPLYASASPTSAAEQTQATPPVRDKMKRLVISPDTLRFNKTPANRSENPTVTVGNPNIVAAQIGGGPVGRRLVVVLLRAGGDNRGAVKPADFEFSDWIPPRRVRAVALGVIRNKDRLLMQEAFDRDTGTMSYRPVGGTIEFLEPGEQTVIREFREELGIELIDVRYVGAIESIGEFARGPWHEINMLYQASFADRANYEVISFHSLPGSGMRYTARWLGLSEIEAKPERIHPPNLMAFLAKSGQ